MNYNQFTYAHNILPAEVPYLFFSTQEEKELELSEVGAV